MSFLSLRFWFPPKEIPAAVTEATSEPDVTSKPPSPTTKRNEDEHSLHDKKKPLRKINEGSSQKEVPSDDHAVTRKSFDETGFIEGKWQGNHLVELYSCQFKHPTSKKTVYIRKQIPGYLFTFDEDNFIARVRFGNIGKWNFFQLSTLRKQTLLNELEIIEVIRDEALNIRDKAFGEIQNLLLKIGEETTKNLDFAEDFFQLLLSLEDFKRFTDNLSILGELLKNNYFSNVLKEIIQQLMTGEKRLIFRRKEFIKSPQQYRNNLLPQLNQICARALENHKRILLKKYFEAISELTSSVIADHLTTMDNNLLFLISYKDVELFADLVNMMKEKPFLDFVADLWNTFFKRVEKIGKGMRRNFSLKQVAPLTNPIYFYLCKSFREVVLDISEKADISLHELLKKNVCGKWMLMEIITWPSNSALNHSLEQQYRFIFLTMKHFEPGCYSYKNKFEYEFQLLKDSRGMEDSASAVSEERSVWAYILDNAIKNLVSKEEFELFEPLIKGFSDFSNNTIENQYEAFRMATLNEIKFIAQTSSYLSKNDSDVMLKKEIEFIRQACSNENSESFRDLIDVFNEFWKNKQTILEQIPAKFPCEDFEQNMEKICRTLLDIAELALHKETNPLEIIKFFRSFNEFLEDMNNLDFAWFIKKDDFENCIPNYYLHNIETYLGLANEDKRSYKVLNPESFINMCEKVPQHFIIDIVQDLLNTVVDLLNQSKWSNEDNLNATSELLSAIKKSFLYLKEQPDYVSFDLFKKESTVPFSSAVRNSCSLEDLKKRIAIVGDSYWYVRRQDEINIEKALELYKKENIENSAKEEILRNCFGKYLEKFELYLQETLELDFEEKIEFIIEEVEASLALLTEIEQRRLDHWDSELKRENFPVLLAGLAAVWSIQNSKDIAGTGKILKPHCIQILCILRLLNVDKDSNGVDKHLAQVLTGQGKSLVLGLLSTLLALMGYKVRMVCYSEYLATRDKNDFESFFKCFGVHKEIAYGTFREMANEVIEPKVNGVERKLRDLVHDLILNRSEEQVGSIKKNDVNGTILLIDEVDVFFSDEFYGNTYNAATSICFQGIATIQEIIWEMAKKKCLSGTIIETVIEKSRSISELNEFLSKPGKYTLLKKENDKLFEKMYTNQSLFEEHVNLMVDYAFNVAFGESFVNKFKINDEGFICVRDDDGIYYTHKCLGYYNVFYYLKLKGNDFETKLFKNYGYLSISCGSISYAKLPQKYPLILGVSGTLTTLHDHEKEAVRDFYKIKENSIMPSFFGDCHLKFDSIRDFVVRDTEEEWLDKIFRHANSQIDSGRSVIIFFDTDREIDQFQQKFLAKFDRLRILTPNTKNLTRERYIDEAGITKTITLATRGMGRGVDYKSSVLVEKYGGVHVIQTFFSMDIKEETQIKGRTARKDCKGSYELILCKEHLKKAKLLATVDVAVNYENLNESRKRQILMEGSKNVDRIFKSENKHEKTMEYFESFFKKSK